MFSPTNSRFIYLRFRSSVFEFSHSRPLHCKKKLSNFPFPSWDVSKQTLPCEKIANLFFTVYRSRMGIIPIQFFKVRSSLSTFRNFQPFEIDHLRLRELERICSHGSSHLETHSNKNLHFVWSSLLLLVHIQESSSSLS
jgi:hypothetical protein